MKKEDIAILAQLLTAMKDSVSKLEEAQAAKNLEKAAAAKREIITFQKKIEEIL
jgi:hypothetical protein